MVAYKALFFDNVAQGPIGEPIRALKSKCPSGTIGGIDFVGASFLEVIVPKGHEADVIDALKICGMKYCPNYSALHGISGFSEEKMDSTRHRLKVQVRIRRMNRLLHFTTDEGTATYYAATLLQADAMMIAIRKNGGTQPPVEEKQLMADDERFVIYRNPKSPRKGSPRKRF